MAAFVDAIADAKSIGSSSVHEDWFSFKGLAQPVVLKLAAPMTDDELIAFSRENKGFRIETNADGELEIMSPVGYRGNQREMFASSRLFDWTEKHGGVCIGADAGCRIGPLEIRSPDAAWVSDERDSTLTEAQREGFLPFAPDFVIELLSQSDNARVLKAKMQIWLEAGTRLAWMVDPYKAEVLVYRLGAEVEALARPDWVEADSVVTGFRLETARILAK